MVGRPGCGPKPFFSMRDLGAKVMQMLLKMHREDSQMPLSGQAWPRGIFWAVLVLFY